MSTAGHRTWRRPGWRLRLALGVVAVALLAACGTCEGAPQSDKGGLAADPDAEPSIPFAPVRFARTVGARGASDAGPDL